MEGEWVRVCVCGEESGGKGVRLSERVRGIMREVEDESA